MDVDNPVGVDVGVSEGTSVGLESYAGACAWGRVLSVKRRPSLVQWWSGLPSRSLRSLTAKLELPRFTVRVGAFT